MSPRLSANTVISAETGFSARTPVVEAGWTNGCLVYLKEEFVVNCNSHLDILFGM